ncbi:MAG: hypothetical protein IPM54_38405 [Polyangiaceae bacterium]|nr:hypothetical protein [Polyangiaceae bacterium]
MWDSPFATRGTPKIALNDVGKCLEERLYREPSVDVRRFELEVGWLRRLAVITEENARRGENNRVKSQEPHRQRDNELLCAFGTRIELIRKRRAEEHRAHAATVKRHNASQSALPSLPTKLPDVFQVDFVNIGDARDARKTIRDRLKKKKPIHVRLIELRPTDPQFVPLAPHLYCSTTETEGFNLPLEEADRRSGVSQPFYVKNIEDRDGKKIARMMMLTADPDQNK